MASTPVVLKSIKLNAPVALPVVTRPAGDIEIPIGWQPVRGQKIPVGMPEHLWKAELERRETQAAITYARSVGRKIAWNIEYWRRRGHHGESVESLFEFVAFNQPDLFPRRYLVAPKYYKNTLRYVKALLAQAAQKRIQESKLRLEVKRGR